MRQSLWSVLKNYINYHNGILIYRSTLIDYIKSRWDLGYSLHTIDTYRNYLTQAGYLKVVGRGRYLVTKEIPIDLSVSDCKNEAYEENDRLFFNIVDVVDFLSEEDMEI